MHAMGAISVNHTALLADTIQGKLQNDTNMNTSGPDILNDTNGTPYKHNLVAANQSTYSYSKSHTMATHNRVHGSFTKSCLNCTL